jgi:O-acetyl-ADP-ribose deacetylase (regulator of RNase III)
VKHVKTLLNVILGDITKTNVDIIVNAANASLLGGGGVDGAIHRAGGIDILKECQSIRDRQGGCAVGEAVFTTAGRLPARYVIHTVGPVWQDGASGEVEKLYSCYEKTLSLADDLMAKSIAFPCISTGVYRYPKVDAAQIALLAIRKHVEQKTSIERIDLVCFDEESYEIYQRLLGA